jgi:hypothetical protein
VSYNLAFDVLAASRLAAIEEATTRLRTGLKLRGVVSAEPAFNGFWHVVLSVWEDA